MDRTVLSGFCSAVRCSLQYLVENTDPALRIAPLFEVQLTLTSDMTFHPSLDLSKKDNFYDVVDQMVADIFKMASFMKRVAKIKQTETYQVCIHKSFKSSGKVDYFIILYPSLLFCRLMWIRYLS